MRVTASGLERALRCGASLHLPVVRSSSAAADRGTWRHAFLARVGQVGADVALTEVPEEHRPACEALPIDELPTGLTAEVAFAYDTATDRGRIIGVNLDRNYGELAPGEVAGAADVVGLAGGTALVLDWKSVGYRQHARDSVQLRFLALAAARVYQVETVRVEIVRLGDDGEAWRSWHVYDTLDLDIFAAELRAWAAGAAEGREFHEGEWCSHCPSFSYCPAKTMLALQIAEGRVLEGPDTNIPLSPERAGVVWTRLRTARQLLAHVERAMMATLEEHGFLPLPGGKSLVRKTVPGNEKLSGDVVYDVLVEKHGADVARAAVGMVATKVGLKDALRPLGTKRGQLSRMEAEVLEEVRKRNGSQRGTRVELQEIEG